MAALVATLPRIIIDLLIFTLIHGNMLSLESRQRFGTQVIALGYADKFLCVFTYAGEYSFDTVLYQVSDARVCKLQC